MIKEYFGGKVFMRDLQPRGIKNEHLSLFFSYREYENNR